MKRVEQYEIKQMNPDNLSESVVQTLMIKLKRRMEA